MPAHRGGNMVYYGTGISRGVAAGPIYCYEPFVPAPPCPAHGGSVEEQRALYEAAKQTAHAELSCMCARLEANKAAIFEAHMDILDDEVMDEEILAGIEGEQWTAQWAVEQVYEHYRAVLGNAPDARIRERAADLSDVKLRLLRILQGAPARGLDSLERPVIVAAKELLPSDTAAMDRANVLGIVTEMGGATSHSAILARSWGIPAVLGANILSIKDAVQVGIVGAEVPMYLVGVAVAAVTGYLCIRLLKYIADKGRFGAFAYYCWAAGVLTLVLQGIK